MEIGISGLVIAFLFNPYVIPMMEAIAISFIELISGRIKAI
ncbi:CD1845 family protein [Veillonella sp.]